ncbi:MAG: Archaeal Type pilin, N-terminal [Thermoplasmata archaeon]|jgi:flagellin-like protein|nr:Archaeal Type pilin, N-terminal [Thermoplasmata archaeon]
MKANQAFKANDEAVSPVIGVILMVAITVVLAAVVFVLVSNLSKGSNNSAPTLAINTDDTADKLIITSAATGADWSRLSVKVASCTQANNAGDLINMGTATPYQNDPAVSAGADLNAAAAMGTACGAGALVQVTATSVPIAAGDFLQFCTSPFGMGTSAATNVVIDVIDTVANSAIGSYTFTSVALCTA